MIDLQHPLANEWVALQPLTSDDYLLLYNIAADPLIWEQHPNNDRYQEPVFKQFFFDAIASKGAYKILDKRTNQYVGSTRFYDYNPSQRSIAIGATFFARSVWGTGVNDIVKKLMINYISLYVNTIYFYIGEQNYRSQKAIEKLGAVKTGKVKIPNNPFYNYIYQLQLLKTQ